ncbi:MAG: DUF302 domain-containing protein [Planctomycetota bacterium]|jgi:uncharacterized protein (DUF302 family)
MSKYVGFLLGVLVGAGFLGAVVWFSGPDLMLQERPSRVGLDATVDRLTKAAKAEGWVVSSIQKLDQSIVKHGGPKVRPVRLVNLCHPQHAAKILNVDGARIVSVMMPCTIAVYEKSDGTVWAANMNAKLLGSMFGGVVSEVMAGPVAESQDKFLATLD